MTLPAEYPPTTPADAGRDAKGRFTKGNTEGKGNPFARRVALLRSALLEEVDETKFRKMVRDLVEMALNKDIAAIKLVFLYVLGKPADMVNPDDLDRLEFEQLARDVVPAAVLNAINTSSMPATLANEFLKLTQVHQGKQIATTAATVLETGVLPGQEEQADDEEDPEDEAPPAPEASPTPTDPVTFPFNGTVNKRPEPANKAANTGQPKPRRKGGKRRKGRR